MKYPANVGDSWNILRSGLPGETIAYLMSTDTPVEINNITIKCYVYEYHDNGILQRKHFVSPTLGIVKTEIYTSTSGNTVELVRQAVLTEYKVN